eukprot:EG_transcript_15827
MLRAISLPGSPLWASIVPWILNPLKALDPSRKTTAAAAGAPPPPTTSPGGRAPGLYQRRHSALEEAAAFLRAVLFLYVTFMVAVPLYFFGILPLYFYCRWFDPYVRRPLDWFNYAWGALSCMPFCQVEVVNAHLLPPEGVPVIYVANHQSWLDILATYSIGRSFKWVSKSTIFYVPVIGWAMALTGHVSLNRSSRLSEMQVARDSMDKLRNGASMFVFPEGTRSKTGKVGPFRQGAFSMARKVGVPVVPITIIGSGNTMPPGKLRLYRRSHKVSIVVHPMVHPADVTDDQQLLQQCRNAVLSALPPELH